MFLKKVPKKVKKITQKVKVTQKSTQKSKFTQKAARKSKFIKKAVQKCEFTQKVGGGSLAIIISFYSTVYLSYSNIYPTSRDLGTTE